jgi:hypothetical protein
MLNDFDAVLSRETNKDSELLYNNNEI